MNKLMLAFALFSGCLLFAQSSPISSYIIRNDGSKQIVVIQGTSSVNNPTKITTQNTESSVKKTYSIDDLQEFGLEDGTVYKRATILMDVSSNQSEKFSTSREPTYEERTVFLKTLVQGEASLYQYISVGYLKYFYSVGSNDIKQLLYKRYKVKGKVLENNEYKQTLSNEFSCDGMQERMFSKLKYSPKSLKNIFNDYNVCTNSTSTYVQQSANDLDKRKSFNVRAKAGLRLNSFEFDNEGSTIDLSSKAGVQLGFEGEYAFETTDYNFSLLVEGVYFSYSQNSRITNENENDTFETYELNYNAIELSFGGRYSIPINAKSRVFANLLYTTPLHLIDALASSDIDNVTTFESQGNLSYGAGIELNRVSIELRLQSARDVLPDLDSAYNNTSLSLGYRF